MKWEGVCTNKQIKQVKLTEYSLNTYVQVIERRRERKYDKLFVLFKLREIIKHRLTGQIITDASGNAKGKIPSHMCIQLQWKFPVYTSKTVRKSS